MELLAVEDAPAKKNRRKPRGKKKKTVKTANSPQCMPEQSVADGEENQGNMIMALEAAESTKCAGNEAAYDVFDKSSLKRSLSVECVSSARDIVTDEAVSELETGTGTDSISSGDLSHIEDKQTTKETQDCDEQQLLCGEWPTLQESNSRLHSIKVPTLQSDGDVIMIDQVILVDDQGESTPPGDFRIHALSSLKGHDASSMLSNPEDATEESQVVKAPMPKCQYDQIGKVMCSNHLDEDHFSLFHKFPGDYTRVNSPYRGTHVERSHLESTPTPTEFDHCYSLFGNDQWNPLSSVLKRSLQPLSGQNVRGSPSQ